MITMSTKLQQTILTGNFSELRTLLAPFSSNEMASEFLIRFLFESIDVMRPIKTPEESVCGYFEGYSNPLGLAIHQLELSFTWSFDPKKDASIFFGNVVRPFILALSPHSVYSLLSLMEYAEALALKNVCSLPQQNTKNQKPPPYFGANLLIREIEEVLQPQWKKMNLLPEILSTWAKGEFLLQNSLLQEKVPLLLREKLERLDTGAKHQAHLALPQKVLNLWACLDPQKPDLRRQVLGSVRQQLSTFSSSDCIKFPLWIRLFQDTELMKANQAPQLPQSNRGEENFACLILRKYLHEFLFEEIDFFLEPKTLRLLGFSMEKTQNFPYDMGPNTSSFECDNLFRMLERGVSIDEILHPKNEDKDDDFDDDLEGASKEDKRFFKDPSVKARLMKPEDPFFQTLLGKSFELLFNFSARLQLKDLFKQLRDEGPFTIEHRLSTYEQKSWKQHPSDLALFTQIKEYLLTQWKQEKFTFPSEYDLGKELWQEDFLALLKRLATPYIQELEGMDPEEICSYFLKENRPAIPKAINALFTLWKGALLLLSVPNLQAWSLWIKWTCPQAYISYEDFWNELTAILKTRPFIAELYESLLFYGEPTHQTWCYLLWDLYRIETEIAYVTTAKILAQVRPPEEKSYYRRSQSYNYLQAIFWKAWNNEHFELLANAIETCSVALVNETDRAYLPKMNYPIWFRYAVAEPTQKGVDFKEVWSKISQSFPERIPQILKQVLRHLEYEKFPATLLTIASQVNGVEILKDFLPALQQTACSLNGNGATQILTVLAKHPELFQQKQEDLLQIARSNLSPAPTSRSEAAVALLKNIPHFFPLLIPEVLSILGEGLSFKNPKMQQLISDVYQNTLSIQQQKGIHSTFARISSIPRKTSIPFDQLFFPKNERVDLHINNESRAFSLSDGDPVKKEEDDTLHERTQELAEKGALMPLLHDSKVDFCARIVVNAPLTPQEEQEWMGKVTWKLDVPSGILLLMGGISFIPINDPVQDYFARILIPPGKYKVTVYSHLPCPYSQFIFAQAQEKSKSKESVFQWFKRTRPKTAIPSWLDNDSDEEDDSEEEDETDESEDDYSEANETVDTESVNEPQEELASYERDLLEKKQKPSYYLSYLIHLEKSEALPEHFPEMDYGLFFPEARPLPELCPLGIQAQLLNPPKKEEDEDEDEDEEPYTHTVDVLQQLAEVEKIKLDPFIYDLKDIELFRDLFYFMGTQSFAEVAFQIQLPASIQELNPEWKMLHYVQIEKRNNSFCIRPAGELDYGDLSIWLRRASSVLMALPEKTRLGLGLCSSDSRNEGKGSQYFEGEVLSAGKWQIDQVYPSIQRTHFEEALTLAHHLRFSKEIACLSEKELEDTVVLLSKDLWCPYMERNGLALRLRSVTMDVFTMNTNDSLQNLAETLFNLRLGKYWGREEPTLPEGSWARNFKLRRLWIDRTIHPPEIFFRGKVLVATRSFPEKSQILSAEEIQTMNAPLEKLGFQPIGDFYCEQFSNLLIRAYANPKEKTFGVYYVTDTGPRSFEFYTGFDDNSSYTTSNGDEFAEKPKAKSFGRKYPKAPPETLWTHHLQGIQKQHEKGHKKLNIACTLNDLADAMDRYFEKIPFFSV